MRLVLLLHLLTRSVMQIRRRLIESKKARERKSTLRLITFKFGGKKCCFRLQTSSCLRRKTNPKLFRRNDPIRTTRGQVRTKSNERNVDRIQNDVSIRSLSANLMTNVIITRLMRIAFQSRPRRSAVEPKESKIEKHGETTN
jgi:hypothetical protein